MAEKDYAPLTSALVRALNDKLYEKRKVAALEIERMVREFVAQNKTNQIRSLLQVLGQDFTLSHNPNSRKGGLIGLAATAIALGKETCGGYVQELVKPILACFFDSDSRVRYYGCEALYNIVKVAWASVLPFFNDIFDGLSRLAADPDQNVRSGAELLDRLMKDIITESDTFDLDAFVPLLRERIYTKNSFARQFVVSWVSTLDAVPGIDILRVLSEVLDGLFHILGDGNPEIRKMCESVLSDLLRGITQSPENVNYCGMTNILIVHCQSTDLVIQYTALCWLKEFVQLSGRATLPFSSGLLCALLPCLSYDEGERRRSILVPRFGSIFVGRRNR